MSTDVWCEGTSQWRTMQRGVRVQALLQHVCCFAKSFGVSIVSKKQSTCTCFASFNCVSTKFDHYLDYEATAPWRNSNNTRCRMVLPPLHRKLQGNLKASLRRIRGQSMFTPLFSMDKWFWIILFYELLYIVNYCDVFVLLLYFFRK